MGLEKIEEYKKRLGMTTAELSEKSGVPKGTLDKILSGVTRDPREFPAETVNSLLVSEAVLFLLWQLLVCLFFLYRLWILLHFL